MSATITASQVKELRDKSGAGMMECKKALQETGGDVGAAMKHLRERGIAKGEKRAGRAASEGVVSIVTNDAGTAAAMIELNSETDFVARNEEFQQTAKAISEAVLAAKVTSAEEASKLDIGGKSAGDAVNDLLAKIGEKITLSRADYIEGGAIGSYVHMNSKIGVVVAAKVDGADSDKAREILVDVAMHIAAANPRFMFASEVDQSTLDAESEIFAAMAAKEGKPENIIPRIVEGKIKSFYKDNCLVDQAFVKDPKSSVSDYVNSSAKAAGGTMEITRFVRFGVGEGAGQSDEA